MTEQGTKEGLVDQIMDSDHVTNMDLHDRAAYKARLETMSSTELEKELAAVASQF